MLVRGTAKFSESSSPRAGLCGYETERRDDGSGGSRARRCGHDNVRVHGTAASRGARAALRSDGRRAPRDGALGAMPRLSAAGEEYLPVGVRVSTVDYPDFI